MRGRKFKMIFLLPGLLILILSCASRPPATISVFNPTFERAKDKVEPVLVSMNDPAEQVLKAAEDVLILLSIPYELQTGVRESTLRMKKAWIAGPDKAFGEYFEYERKPEHAKYWDFDPASLESGRRENIGNYMRTGSEGVTGFVKSAKGEYHQINNAYFEGEIKVRPVGRLRSILGIKTIFYDAEFKGKAYRSESRIEEELGELCQAMLDVQSSVLPAGREEVKAAVKKWLEIQDMTVEEESDERIVTSRNFTEVGWEGPKTIDRYADVPTFSSGSVMGIWFGTYKAVIRIAPEQEGSATRITPEFLFMGINLNYGKRRWMELPSERVLEDDLLAFVRREVQEEKE